MPRIIISIEGVVIREVQLTAERTTLGRRPYNDVVIDNLAVSGEHAAIHLSGGEARLEDLSSTNGSYVNGRSVKTQVLQNNDTIEIGKYRIKFADDSVPAADHDAAEPQSGDTVPADLGEAGAGARGGPVASMKVLSGGALGREFPLLKAVTRIGRPGVAVAAITRGRGGFVVRGLEGASTLNGAPIGAAAHELKDGDLLELAGTRIAFIQAH